MAPIGHRDHIVIRIVQGASVLLLLSIFFAYVLVPIVDAARRRARFGRRRRPASRAAVTLTLCVVIWASAFLVWKAAAAPIRHGITVVAPSAIDRLFSGRDNQPLDAVLRRIPPAMPLRQAVVISTHGGIAYLEREVRATFDDLVAASRNARWLVIVPIVAFCLITMAPGFRRSAQRLLPHGHLKWRAGEYLRDVNSALAGYVRAQLAAGLIVGAACSVGFTLLGLPYALPMGAAAGVLELVPAIGPVTVLLIATSQAGRGALVVAAFLLSLRVAQDYLIYPRLIRRGMHLSTPVVVVAIWCGAAFAGAAGVVLAIPIAGFSSVSLRHWMEYRAIERVVRNHARRRADRADADVVPGPDVV
jgi:predicted PurR-regulated permease PerM